MIDLVIIGGGPAGLSAAIYGARGGLQTVVFERALVGGQIILTAEIENYPGFEEVMSGFELIAKMQQQAEKFGVMFKEEEVIEIINHADHKKILTTESSYQAKAVIIATGASPRKLGVLGEERLTGRGVSYCATCDGALYRNKTVAVIGGGDSAIEEAMFLTKFAQKVYVIHRRDQLRAIHAIQQKAFQNSKLEFFFDTIVEEICGESQVHSLQLYHTKLRKKTELLINGVFIYVGIIPNNSLVKDFVELDPDGFIITDDDMHTLTKGFYVVGDIRQKTLRQVVTAVADGAIASFVAEKELIAEG